MSASSTIHMDLLVAVHARNVLFIISFLRLHVSEYNVLNLSGRKLSSKGNL
jgi:hypothetical protein